MPAWIYALAVVAVLWAVFVAVFHPFRRGAHAAPRALPVRVDAGSMVLAEERTAWLSAPPWQPLEYSESDRTAPPIANPRAGELGASAGRGGVATVTLTPAPAPLSLGEVEHDPAGCHRGGRPHLGPCVNPLGPYGGQLGPRARAVLAAYNAQCVERWGHAIAG